MARPGLAPDPSQAYAHGYILTPLRGSTRTTGTGIRRANNSNNPVPRQCRWLGESCEAAVGVGIRRDASYRPSL